MYKQVPFRKASWGSPPPPPHPPPPPPQFPLLLHHQPPLSLFLPQQSPHARPYNCTCLLILSRYCYYDSGLGPVLCPIQCSMIVFDPMSVCMGPGDCARSLGTCSRHCWQVTHEQCLLAGARQSQIHAFRPLMPAYCSVLVGSCYIAAIVHRSIVTTTPLILYTHTPGHLFWSMDPWSSCMNINDHRPVWSS